jgi:AAA+ ATPase superfamily predicted ATPase
MPLPFLDRQEEAARLRALFARRRGALAVLHGRRRCGKSRLLQETLPRGRSVYYVADDREASIQRIALAGEVARLLPGFAAVAYPSWDALLERWWREARPGSVLALDEFPSLVSSGPELPSLLQKHVDQKAGTGVHVVLSGSSQRLMQGLVLDRSAPLFGRATELLRIGSLGAGWVGEALGLRDSRAAVEAFALWGGVPRYWELASDLGGLERAMRELVLSPLGVLHDEPASLLLDDLREITQASSILTLVGAGCHRMSEIAARLERPATSLTRPLARLLDLGLVRRDLPFGAAGRESKRSLYRVADPFLRFWFRYVEPNRSRLEARLVADVEHDVARSFPEHVASVWEDLVRESVPRARCFGIAWGPAASWWGPGRDRTPLELDVVAESVDGQTLLAGEAKWTDRVDWARELATLERKAHNLPFTGGRQVRLALWAKNAPRGVGPGSGCFTPREVLPALR